MGKKEQGSPPVRGVWVARLFGASCVRVIQPGYATIEVELKNEKAAGDRESVKAGGALVHRAHRAEEEEAH